MQTHLRAAALALLAGTACAAAAGTPPPAPVPAAAAAAAAGVLPAARRTLWRPGLPGGVPRGQRVCATLDARRLGDGRADATAAIQAALDACPEGQAVLLPAGSYRTSAVLWIRKGVVLRGAGPTRTRIERVGARDDYGGPVIRVNADSAHLPGVALARDAPAGASRLEVADASTFRAGDVVQVDQRDDPSVVTGGCRWFKRLDPDGAARSVGQRVEIAAVEGRTGLRLASPLHLPYTVARRAEVVGTDRPSVRGAGIEDLAVSGGKQASIHLAFAAYSWIRNVESDGVFGRHLAIAACYRCEVRDSFVHHATGGYESGARAYGISLMAQTSDTLVENNVVYYLNKLVTLEAAGGGNVIAYNYLDDPILGQRPAWQEVALDASHCSHPHMTLFEGNWAPHMGAAATHGSASHLTFFRNHASSQARTLLHTENVEAVQLDAGMWHVSFLGNALSRPGLRTVYEPTPDPDRPGTYTWSSIAAPVKVWMLGGWAKEDSPQHFDPKVRATLLRHGNLDRSTGKVQWDPGVKGRELPPSLYLAEKPGFFGDAPWPFVDPLRDPPVGTLPAKVRFDATGAPRAGRRRRGLTRSATARRAPRARA